MDFSVYTLGCKLNQLETEAIADAFSREGFSFIPWNTVPGIGERGEAAAGNVSTENGPPHPLLLIINTCTVTSMAEQKARRIIRKVLNENPAACLLITGCYAQMEREAVSSLGAEQAAAGQHHPEGGRLFVVPGEDKDSILDLPRFLAASGYDAALPALVASWLAASGAGEKRGEGSFRYRPEHFVSHSRGFLKIQDGCDRRCAYCRVTLARGKSRSLGAAEVLSGLRELEQRGYAEAVLTGVNITQYRDPELDSPGLPGLLDFLLNGTKDIRLRLSSIEPDWFAPEYNSAEFAGVLANPRIRPHFHLSLQSGSDTILAKMGRPYTRSDIEKTVTLLRSIRQDPFLACDIIAGFPGETEEDFEKTRQLCESTGFAWIHAFPFSRRPGTAAYNFPDQVSEKESVGRVEILSALARKGRREYLNRWEGKEVEAVVEKGSGSKLQGLSTCFVPAVSENYLKLLVDCGEHVPAQGSLIRCRIRQTQAPSQNPHTPRDPAAGTSRFDATAEIKETICPGRQ